MSTARLVTLLLCCLQLACETESKSNGTEPASSGSVIRLVTLAPHLTELVFAAGAGDGLVGVVRYSDYPPAATRLPSVGDAFRVDYEQMIKLAPDVVLAWQAGTPREVTQYLRGLGFEVLELDSYQLGDIPAQIEYLGQLADTSEVADRVAAELRSRLTTMHEKYANRSPVSVFLQISAEPWFTVTANHILTDAIELCGGRNIFAELDGVAPMVSFEAIIDANPAAILVITASPEEEWQGVWSSWQHLDAVASRHVYPVGADYVSRAGPRMIEGTARICAALADARENQSADLLR